MINKSNMSSLTVSSILDPRNPVHSQYKHIKAIELGLYISFAELCNNSRFT